jgi:hypothetical protein
VLAECRAPGPHAIRKHWSIENGQHWVLDIACGKGDKAVRAAPIDWENGGCAAWAHRDPLPEGTLSGWGGGERFDWGAGA